MAKRTWVDSFFAGVAVGRSAHPTKLTLFPPPEEDSRSNSFKDLVPNVRNVKKCPVLPDSPVSGIPGRELREFWMPDRLCRTCYDCEQPFSMFRRRHHCRICGQIFCNSCASMFIEGPLGAHGAIRTCKVCYSQLTNVPLARIPKSSPCAQHLAHTSLLHEGVQILLTDSPYRQDHPVAVYGSEGNMAEKVADVQQVGAGALVREQSNYEAFNCNEHRNKVRRTRKCHVKRSSEKFAAPYPSSTTRNRNSSSCTHLITIQLREMFPPKGCTQYNARFLSSWTCSANHPMLRGCVNDWPSRSISAHKCNLALWVSQQLREMILGLVHRAKWCSAGCEELWADLIVGLVRKACSTVQSSAFFWASLDIRQLVQIKVIPGGTLHESKCEDGIVFQERLVQNSMQRSFCRPKIMLIANGIEYNRSLGKMASLETLLEQEPKYSEIMVEKMIRLKPDMVFVEQTVSRDALHFLKQREITVYQNVRRKLMRRLCCMTGAVVFSSIDQVGSLGHGTDSLGFCRAFQTIQFESQLLEDHYSCLHCQSSKGVSVHLKQVRGHGQIRYAYIHGCQSKAGCTIVLRGSHLHALKALKKIVRFACHAAYYMQLETAYLLDRGAWHAERNNSILTALVNKNIETPIALTCGDQDVAVYTNLQAHNHQSLLLTSVWVHSHEASPPADLKAITYYTSQDFTLGDFLTSYCFYSDGRCFANDRQLSDNWAQSFYHANGSLSLSLDKLEKKSFSASWRPKLWSKINENPLFIWSSCRKCGCSVTPVVPISHGTRKFSFGKLLETLFQNTAIAFQDSSCCHYSYNEHILHFAYADMVAHLEYQEVKTYTLHIRRSLPLDLVCEGCTAKGKLRDFQNAVNQLMNSFDSNMRRIHVLGAQLCADVELDHASHVAVTTIQAELKQINTQMHAFMCQFETRLENVKCSTSFPFHDHKRETLGHKVIEDSRLQLYTQAAAWNAQISLLGPLITKLCDKHHKEASDVNLDIQGVFQKLLKIKDSCSHTFGSLCCELSEDTMSADTRDAGIPRARQDQASRDSCNCVRSALKLKHMSKGVSECPPCFGGYQRDVGYECHNTSCVGTDTHAGMETAFNQDPSCCLLMQPARTPENSVDVESMPRVDEVEQSDSWTTASFGVVRHSVPLPGNDKRSSRISSAFARLMGKEIREANPWTVSLSNIGGRFRISTQDQGRVFPSAKDHSSTSLIAYSLETPEYNQALAHLLRTSTCRFASSAELMESNQECPSNPVNRVITEHHALQTDMKGWLGMSGFVQCSETMHPHLRMAVSQEAQTHELCASVESMPLNGDLRTNFQGCQGRPMNDVTGISATLLETDDEHNFRIASSEVKDTKAANLSLHLGVDSRCCTCKLELRSMSPLKSHVKHRFADIDAEGTVTCNYVCHIFWAVQFLAVRQAFLGFAPDQEQGYHTSLDQALPWNAQGGKSGATFFKTFDGRFVVKHVTRTELHMFLDCALAYFEYISRTLFHGCPSLLVKILGVYQIGSHNKISGKRTIDHIVVMENLFHGVGVLHAFDLKGSTRSRYARACEGVGVGPRVSRDTEHLVLLDENFTEYTQGRPFPLQDTAKALFDAAVLNDTLFLSLINIVDYSMLIGINDEKRKLVVGIIDYMRQYDMLKKVERMGKSVGMIAGQAEPTVIQPPNYRHRFCAAMERYFMMVPDNWTDLRLASFNSMSR